MGWVKWENGVMRGMCVGGRETGDGGDGFDKGDG